MLFRRISGVVQTNSFKRLVTGLFSIIWCDLQVAPKVGRGRGETIFPLFSGTLHRFEQRVPILLDKGKAKILIGWEKPVYNALIPQG